MEMKIIVRWRTRDEESIAHIRRRFGFPSYTTLNGWTPGLLKAEDKESLDDYVTFGFLTYRQADWSFNGVTYSW